MSKCDCFKETLSEVKEHLKEKQIPENATEFKASWEGASVIFADDYVPVNPVIQYQYRKTKKDGSPAKNLTKETVSILCGYCPFCGRQIEKGSGHE